MQQISDCVIQDATEVCNMFNRLTKPLVRLSVAV